VPFLPSPAIPAGIYVVDKTFAIDVAKVPEGLWIWGRCVRFVARDTPLEFFNRIDRKQTAAVFNCGRRNWLLARNPRGNCRYVS